MVSGPKTRSKVNVFVVDVADEIFPTSCLTTISLFNGWHFTTDGELSLTSFPLRGLKKIQGENKKINENTSVTFGWVLSSVYLPTLCCGFGRDVANSLSSVTLIFRDSDSVPDPLDACAISTRYLQKNIFTCTAIWARDDSFWEIWKYEIFLWFLERKITSNLITKAVEDAKELSIANSHLRVI